MKANTRLLLPACILALLTIATSAHAAPLALPSPPSLPIAMELPHIVSSLLASIVFGLVGIVLAIAGFKLFDLVTPFDLEKEMCENKNIAVGILCAAIVLGICHIIAASMS
jgi:putative membrane protein